MTLECRPFGKRLVGSLYLLFALSSRSLLYLHPWLNLWYLTVIVTQDWFWGEKIKTFVMTVHLNSPLKATYKNARLSFLDANRIHSPSNLMIIITIYWVKSSWLKRVFEVCSFIFADLLGLDHSGFLVYRVDRAEQSVLLVAVWRKAQCILDDWFL